MLIETATLEAVAQKNPVLAELEDEDVAFEGNQFSDHEFATDGSPLVRLRPDDIGNARASMLAELARSSTTANKEWLEGRIPLEHLPDDLESDTAGLLKRLSFDTAEKDKKKKKKSKLQEESDEEIDDGFDGVGEGERRQIRAFSHSIVLPPRARKKANQSRMVRLGMIVMHPSVLRLLESHVERFQHVTHFPMLVPPRPWQSPNKGGYLKQRCMFMRPAGSNLQFEVLKHAHMPQLMEALNVLGRVPWSINHVVHDTVKRVWEEGGGLGEVPQRTDLDMPTPEQVRSEYPDIDEEALEKRWRYITRRYRQMNADLHSLRCDMLLKLKVADMFRDEVRKKETDVEETVV